ncbi:MAG: hypothetical protein AVDCRST_MAG77-5798, partial [uncultured Chloroflexi bacterium]
WQHSWSRRPSSLLVSRLRPPPVRPGTRCDAPAQRAARRYLCRQRTTRSGGWIRRPLRPSDHISIPPTARKRCWRRKSNLRLRPPSRQRVLPNRCLPNRRTRVQAIRRSIRRHATSWLTRQPRSRMIPCRRRHGRATRTKRKSSTLRTSLRGGASGRDGA